MSLNYNGKLISFARELRKNAARKENHLWDDFLKSYPVRFQRQKRIEDYIVDFYCHSAKLVIELDGSQHYSEQGENADIERDKFLNSKNLKVLRFSNLDIDTNFEGVCIIIDKTVRERINSLSQLR